MDVSNSDKCMSQKSNGAAHLYNDSKYAHFSQITEHNKDKFPLFNKATPIEFTLYPGDCLYIPPKWWHWVKSFGERCISINFWFSNLKGVDVGKEPKKFDKILRWLALEKWSNEHLIETSEKCSKEGLWVWTEGFAYKKRISMREFIEIYGNNKEQTKEFAYLITLSDYEHPGSISNRRIIDELSCDFSFPFSEIESSAELGHNFWMNFGGIDTGLHYDDDEGLLCVVDGTKKVILYPPDDSQYLYPYPANAVRLLPVNINFMYNLYKECYTYQTKAGLEQKDIGIHTLLELTLKKAPNLAILTQKLQRHVVLGRIVYGIKNVNGLIKWEYYFYGIDRHCNTYQESPLFFKRDTYNKDLSLDNIASFLNGEGFKLKTSHINHHRLILYSLDFTEESVIDKSINKINLYYSIVNQVKIPFILNEQTLMLAETKEENKQEINSIQYIDLYGSIFVDIETVTNHFRKIGVSNDDIENILKFVNYSEYRCISVSLVNKKEEVGIYFFGIAYEAFLSFLLEYLYPPDVLDLVSKNKDTFSNVQLEVGFHFKKGDRTSKPSRTAFYGLF